MQDSLQGNDLPQGMDGQTKGQINPTGDAVICADLQYGYQHQLEKNRDILKIYSAALVQCNLFCQCLIQLQRFFTGESVQEPAGSPPQAFGKPAGNNGDPCNSQQCQIQSGTQQEQVPESADLLRQYGMGCDKACYGKTYGDRLKRAELHEQCQRTTGNRNMVPVHIIQLHGLAAAGRGRDGTEKETRQCIPNGLPEVAAAAQQMQAFSDIDRFAQQKDTHTASSKQKIPDFYRQQNSGKLGQILSPQQNVKCQGDQP